MNLKDKRWEANEAVWRNAMALYQRDEGIALVASNLNVSKKFIEDRLGFQDGDSYPLKHCGFSLKFIRRTLADIWLEKRNLGN